jgi:hypothetical protein
MHTQQHQQVYEYGGQLVIAIPTPQDQLPEYKYTYKPAKKCSKDFDSFSDSDVESFVQSHRNGASILEISRAVNLTHQRIQQVLARALANLKKECIKRGIASDDLDFLMKSSEFDYL